ncbi:MlaD family protein [Mycolicibacterium sp.]|uniref:MCE family protein n=1 Tax=Mycolicibacterium sp. TaxID=2320850 RepID=UPI001A34CA43|nr:MlaD family protein [Mycolicibacterium sp.]MBJ7337178.1 MCE family protein [Mycolicibacterium sp.]
MLTRFIKIQLIIFAVASLVGITVMAFSYLQAPTLLGVGRITVKLDLPTSGGLYRFSNVTYRGVQIGTVTGVDVRRTGAIATLSLDTSPQIPADLKAEVHSVSAVGEQYVDLVPNSDAPPFLHDGSVIAKGATTVPQEVGPMLDQVSSLVDSIPKDKLSDLLDESYKGLNGAGYDFGSLLDSSSTVIGDLNRVSDQTRTLVEDAGPLLDTQAQTVDSIRSWAHSLAGFSGQLAQNDPELRTLLQTGPGAVDEVSSLLDQVKPTLPILLANLTTIGQIGVTYHASLEQLLVLLPPYVAAVQTTGLVRNNGEGIPLGDFGIGISDPPACTVGFLPPSAWRSPEETTTLDTPDGLYCKLPQDSPIAVRGARNYPCMGHPGKRAPTVEICDSDQPYEPLAQRQHTLGPYPIDPNLISQGVPPDSRVNPDANIYGPIEGSPLPPGSPGPSGTPPDATEPTPAQAPIPSSPPVAPSDVLAPNAVPGDPPAAAPSSFSGNGSGGGPSVAVVHYDPRTGRYVGPDGHMYTQADLTAPAAARNWKDMLTS